MGEINRVLRHASQRMLLSEFIAGLVWLSTAALVAILGARIVERVFGWPLAWGKIAIWSAVAVFVGAAVWAIVRRASRLTVARRVDEGGDLKESISTALHVERDQTPWSKAVVETAVRAAATVNVRRAVPIQAPRQWPAPMVAALALLVVWLVFPSLDILGNQAQAKARQNDEKKAEQAKVEAKAATDKVQELLAKVDPEKPEAPKPGETPTPKASTPDEVRRAAIKSLTDMKDRLQQLKGSSKSMAGEVLKDKMKQLKPPGPGPLAEVAKAMANGEFEQAAEALKELSQKLAAGDMSSEQKEQLAKQLEKMKDQLAKLGEDRKGLEEKLAQAGLDKKLAADPEALKQAMEQMQNLTQEQKDQLAEMAKAMKQANEACQNMGECMGQMCQGMGKDGMSQEGMEGMEGMQGQLGQAEMMMKDMEGVEAALAEAKFQLQQLSQATGDSECKGGMGECEGGLAGESPWKGGEPKSGNGNGMQQGSRDFGGSGRADGGSGSVTPDDENWQKRKARSPLGDGPTIGTTLIQGDQIKGESKAKFQEVADAAAQQATEALESNAIPREYHDIIKHYFGRLQSKSKGGAPASPTAPPTPAADAPAPKP